ncbi:hypothetical protein R1sor_018326 [Riccia sorocarpa]|uniref:Uncharacterized protein n=1 Tax=Riccia sorocarpa TaxID=122646 RepID=A0ABD3ICN3_9MARC
MRNIQRIILEFVWGGDETTNVRHRMAEKVLYQKKTDGGLGLISLQAQTEAFVAKMVRWAYTPGVRDVSRSGKTGTYARLHEAGIEEIGDITADGRTTLPLHRAANPSLPLTPLISRAYDRLSDSTPKHTASFQADSRYLASPLLAPIWCIQIKDNAPSTDAQVSFKDAAMAYRIDQGKLPAKIEDLPREADWSKVPVAMY